MKHSKKSAKRDSSHYKKVKAGPVAALALTEAFQVMRPPPNLTVSEWADRNRMLSPEASAEPGKWDTSRAEYQRGVMDAANDPAVNTIVLMFGSQTGKTSIEENLVGFHIEQDPSPILFVMPTLEMASAFSKDRLSPMVRDTPALHGKIGEARTRDADNTLLHKGFPGGHITIAGANSPASLASRPIRIVIADEVDRYPPSAGAEGDPVSLAVKRTATFWNRLVVLSGTPTVKGFSRIEDAYEESDKRRYWVPCPECGHVQTLVWRNVRWPRGKPEEARYACGDCGSLWSDVARWRAVQAGEWRAEEEFNGTAGFHLNELYSPWARLAETAQNFLEAEPHPERLKVWINTSLAETWEEDAERVDPNALEGRLEKWVGSFPGGILVITAGVDIQDDRIEIEVVGWGLGEESWSLAHKVIYGDPSTKDIWNELDDYLQLRWSVAGKGELPISCVAVDTGGHYTQAAYEFCKPRYNRRIYAIKGMSTAGRPVWPKRASKNNKGKVNLFIVGVSSAKDIIFSRLKERQAGPGYCHFPEGRDGEYFRQLTAERVVTRYVQGFPQRVYVKDPSTRNEALDCRVYAYCALVALNVNWGRLQARYAGVSPEATPRQGPVVPPPDDPGSGGGGGRRSRRRVSRSNWASR